MVLTAIRLFASSLSLVSFATAQLAYSQPDGKTKDFDSSLTLKQGSVAEVIWKLNSTNTGISGYVYSRLGAKPKTILNAQNEVSLWVTSTADAGNEKGYWKCLAPHIDTTDGGSFQWTVDLSDDDINNHNGQFVYRLKPAVADVDATFNDSDIEAPSRGFFILKDDIPDSASSLVSSASSTNSVVEQTSTPTPSETPSQAPDSSSGVSGGAIAGIVVGVVAVGALVIGGLVFWLRKRKGAKLAPLNDATKGFGETGYEAQGTGMGHYPGYAPVASGDQSFYEPQRTGYSDVPVELAPGAQHKHTTAELA